MPYSVRILLESAIRNCDNFKVTRNDVEKIIDWENTSQKQTEIPFMPARVLLQVCSIFFLMKLILDLKVCIFFCFLFLILKTFAFVVDKRMLLEFQL